MLARPKLWVLGAAGAALAAWWAWKRGLLEEDSPELGGDEVPQDTSDWLDRVTPGPGAVVHRERADGADPRLQAFLDAWEESGSFIICICPEGGVRDDEARQEALRASGHSNAATLADTPHGRGGALDVAPYYRFAAQYGDWGPFEELGAFAKSMGLKWGGDFSSLKDGPHIEVPDWRSLPYPPGRAVA